MKACLSKTSMIAAIFYVGWGSPILMYYWFRPSLPEPVPSVWSVVGPVLPEGVLPVCCVQSNWSWVWSFRNVHRPLSKSHWSLAVMVGGTETTHKRLKFISSCIWGETKLFFIHQGLHVKKSKSFVTIKLINQKTKYNIVKQKHWKTR